jgi:hypothetical protein
MQIEELLEVIGPDTEFYIVAKTGSLTEKAEATRKAVERITGCKCMVSYADCPKCREKVGFIAVVGRNE